jgi:hypothetical protein
MDLNRSQPHSTLFRVFTILKTFLRFFSSLEEQGAARRNSFVLVAVFNMYVSGLGAQIWLLG